MGHLLARLRSPTVLVALLAVVLSLGLLGLRGIWDPDEGRYTNVALNMIESGDWVNPRRNHEVGHWTKPPLTYWAIAASISLFGTHPWAARLPAALAYLLCVWLTWRIARRLAPGSQLQAALIYATMLLPFAASQVITTDFLLAAMEALAVWAFVETRFADTTRPKRWIALMWVGFALAFLTKGPPGLLPLPVLLLFDQLMPGRSRHRLLQWSGLTLFVLLALPWYVAVIANTPGLFAYFVGDEVINRIATDQFNRNGQWYGWLAVYGPTLLLGSVPWTMPLWRGVRRVFEMARRGWHDPEQRARHAPWLLLALWLSLPLLVFCLSQSRLPLYILPLFVPLALLAAMQRHAEGRPLPDWRWLLLWMLLLLGLKLAAAALPSHKNAAAWAEAIRARNPHPVKEVIFVEDMARYGLHLHMGVGTMIEKVSLSQLEQARFNPSYDESLAEELAENEQGLVWITKQANWPRVVTALEAMGYRAAPLGEPFQQRMIFHVSPAPTSQASHRSGQTATRY